MRIRSEEPADATSVRVLSEAAFGSSTEADVVEALRKNVDSLISLVAESDGEVLGHVVFSPVWLDGNSHLRLMGLGPMAVLPARQRQGIGSALVREGLDRCERMGCDAVVVLGHPEYYPRFGFAPASRFGISCKYDVPDEVFMLVELRPGSLQGTTGQVVYDEAFEPNPSMPDHNAEIDSLHAAWQSAFRRQDVEAVLALLTDDYILWAPGRPPIGVEALRPQLAAAFAAYDIEPSFEREERLVTEHLAVERGWDTQILRPRAGGAEHTQRQRVFLVLRRSAEGRWRFARGMSQPGPTT